MGHKKIEGENSEITVKNFKIGQVKANMWWSGNNINTIRVVKRFFKKKEIKSKSNLVGRLKNTNGRLNLLNNAISINVSVLHGF